MEWNGMEWNGMRNGMEWNAEWNGMEWNGMEWNGMEWNGMEWNKKVLVHRHITYLAYLRFVLLAVCLLSAVEWHLALVVALCDEFAFGAGGKV